MDTTQWIIIVLLVILIAAFAFMFLRKPSGRGEDTSTSPARGTADHDHDHDHEHGVGHGHGHGDDHGHGHGDEHGDDHRDAARAGSAGGATAMGESQVFDQEEGTYVDTASGTQVPVEEPEDPSPTGDDHDHDHDVTPEVRPDHPDGSQGAPPAGQDQDQDSRSERGAHSPGLESTTAADPIGPDLSTTGQDHPGGRPEEQTARTWDHQDDDVPDDAAAAGFPAPEEHPDTAPLQQPAPVADSPYGPGSALPDEDGRGPGGWQVKGNVGSMLFHTPDSPSYSTSRAEVWFADEQTARAAGFAHWDRRQR